MSFSAKESLKFYKQYSYDQLVTTLSDYHKDVYGFRLGMNGKPLKEILRQLLFLDKYTADPRNRPELEANGWIFDDQNLTLDEVYLTSDEQFAKLNANDPHLFGPGFGEEEGPVGIEG